MEDLLEQLRTALADRYSVERQVGEGGMAFVFLARDVRHERMVAVKVLKPELASSLGSERFLREIRNAAKLSHPHVLPVYDSGAAGGLLYYVMPFVEGESLSDYIAREKQLSIEEAVKITREVAEALSFAHSYGLVHRDIKPENIMMTGGHAVVTDFGIALAINQAGGERLTSTGMAMGTPAYMSPEQAAGDPNVDGRTDIYSLGCVLYEMLIGQIPFTAPTPQAMIARHTMDHVTPPSIMRDSISADLEGIVFTAMAKTPADRFRTAQEMAEALAAVERGGAPKLRRSTMARPHPMGMYGPPARKPRRNTLLGAAAAVIVVAGGVAVWQLAGSHGVATSTELGGLDPRGVAILYLKDLSGDGSLGYVADGLTEGLIDELSLVSGLNVISRNGAARYRDSGVETDSVARALGVGSLVTGSVEPEGDRLRVTVRLVDGFSGADIGRASWELPAERVLEGRDSIAKSVSGFLRQRLGEEVQLRQRRAGTTDAVAWTFVQRAARLRKDALALEETDPDRAVRTYSEADSLCGLAAARDAQWAEPLVLRGWVAYDLSYLAEEARQRIERMDAAVGFADAAIAVDRAYAEAFHLRGRSRYRLWLLGTSPNPQERERLLEGARADLEAAVEADPKLANAWYALSHLHYQRNDNMSAVIAARRAYEADAFLSNQDRNLFQLFQTHYDLEQFPDAQRWCDEGARRFPGDYRFVECQLWMLITPWATADANRAWRLASTLDTLVPEQTREMVGHRSRMVVGGVLARAGLADSARHVLEGARAGRDVDPEQQLASDEAVMRTLLGDFDEAIELLKRYLAANPGHDFDVDRDLHWWWRPLRDRPGFRAVANPGR